MLCKIFCWFLNIFMALLSELEVIAEAASFAYRGESFFFEPICFFSVFRCLFEL